MDTIQKAASYDVGGVRYPRPFKIRRLGHFGFNVADLEKGLDFYSRLLGFRVRERATSQVPGREEMAKRLQDPRIVFMSHNSDHHAFLLAHKSLGAIFGDDAVSRDVTVNQITWQVGTMDEVFAAADYFRERDVEIRRVGRDMPGSNWHTYIRDPDGHTVELYYGMEQIGWDGRSKPGRCTTAPSARRPSCRRSPRSRRCAMPSPRASTSAPATSSRTAPARNISSPARACRGRSRSRASAR